MGTNKILSRFFNKFSILRVKSNWKHSYLQNRMFPTVWAIKVRQRKGDILQKVSSLRPQSTTFPDQVYLERLDHDSTTLACHIVWPCLHYHSQCTDYLGQQCKPVQLTREQAKVSFFSDSF